LLFLHIPGSEHHREICEKSAKNLRLFSGTLAAVNEVLAKRCWEIHTAFIEHLNLDFRQHVAAIGRRVNTLCKHEAGGRQQLVLFQGYPNFVRPHASLRHPLPQPERPRTALVPQPQAL
jgi:hypothetical protein